MSRHDDDRFRVRVGAPKAKQSRRTERFVTLVLRESSKSGDSRSRVRAPPSLARLGRGHVAANMAGSRLGANARRVVIKARYLVLKQAGARSVATHLRYIEREGVNHDGAKGHAYGAMADEVDLAAFEARGRDAATSSASSSRPRTRRSSKTCVPSLAT